MTAMLSVRGLGVRFPASRRPAIDGVDLELRAGETCAVIGESGSGKTTLALAIAGLLPQRAVIEGTIAWPGRADPPRAGKDIGFVFQDSGASLDPLVRVGSQIAEIAHVHLGMDRRAALARAVELFDQVGLPDPDRIARAYPHQLSGGQKQRVGIAAAVCARPMLLIADEPTSALDTIVQAQVIALLRDTIARSGTTLLLVTHDLPLAAEIADTMLVLLEGRPVEVGPLADIVRRPSSPYTRALLEAALPASERGPAR
jgi:peptide/nickel transport system ATP-binding protein